MAGINAGVGGPGAGGDAAMLGVNSPQSPQSPGEQKVQPLPFCLRYFGRDFAGSALLKEARLTPRPCL